jgi:hypothetical protein
MSKRNFPWAIIAAAAVAGAGFAGVATYVRGEGTDKVIVAQQGGSGKTTVVKDPLSGTGVDQGSNNTEGTANPQIVKVSKVDTLNRAIKDKTFNQKGIRVLDVTVENNGNAIVDMNDPVRYNWGSEEESEFINMMKDILGKFSDIKSFQIRVDGEILKSLSHFEIDPVKIH